MKNILKFLFAFVLITTIVSCEDSLHDDFVNEDSLVPFVMIQDMNENVTGNPNTWNRRLQGENGKTQVRVKFFCSDPNITSHEIVVHRTRRATLMNFDDPLSADFPTVLRSIPLTFPTDEIIITKQQIADLFNVPITSLPNIVYFSGISKNSKGKLINGRSRFEAYTGGSEVRHSYIYEWRFTDGN